MLKQSNPLGLLAFALFAEYTGRHAHWFAEAYSSGEN